MRLSEVAAELRPQVRYIALSGPSHAEVRLQGACQQRWLFREKRKSLP